MTEPGWIGKQLGGRYRLEALLGQGGMSAVYTATDANLHRAVAVKLIHSHLTGDPEFVRRFEVEASAVAQLHHANIIQVYDFNRDDDTYYMVLELIGGESLDRRLRRLVGDGQRLPTEQAAAVAADVADAMDYAHEKGLIHRDIKPANIMLGERGRTVLMDFGVAKIMGATQHTATGAVVGTAFYIAPELVRGEPPSPQSDIYALGASLFEMLAGRPPFTGDSAMSVMMKHLNEPPPDLRHIAPDMPVGLIQVVERSLAKAPDQRFQSAHQLMEALRNFRTATPSRTETKEPTAGRGGPSAATVIDDEPAPAPSLTAAGPFTVNAPSDVVAMGGGTAAAAVRAEPAAVRAGLSNPSAQAGAPRAGAAAVESAHRGGRGLWLAAGVVALLLCLTLGATSIVTGALALPFLVATHTPARPVGTPQVLFQDDFSTEAGKWAVAAGAGGAASYDQGDYVLRVSIPNWAVWSTAAAGGVLSNYHVEVTAGSTGQANDIGFGLLCGYVDESHFDVLAITENGYYQILKRSGGTTAVLSDDQGGWLRSVRITPGGQAYRLGADCGADGRLVLYVDGQQVAVAHDPTLPGGLVGFSVATFGHAPAEVRWKDMLVTRLP